MKYKGFTIDDNKIDKYVDELECSIAEACELILEENGKIEESEDTRKAIAEMIKKTARRYEKSGNRKKTEKVRKVDETKKHLLECVKTLVEGFGATETATKTETELTFNFEGERYTFKLTKHRPPKK